MLNIKPNLNTKNNRQSNSSNQKTSETELAKLAAHYNTSNIHNKSLREEVVRVIKSQFGSNFINN